MFLTFLAIGLTITSLNASSGFILCKFSYKIAIFLSLSQPVGLQQKEWSINHESVSLKKQIRCVFNDKIAIIFRISP